MDPRDGRRADDGGLLQFPGRCATGIGPGQPIAQRIDRTRERHAGLAPMSSIAAAFVAVAFVAFLIALFEVGTVRFTRQQVFLISRIRTEAGVGRPRRGTVKSAHVLHRSAGTVGVMPGGRR
jgi:hypothetical protein